MRVAFITSLTLVGAALGFSGAAAADAAKSNVAENVQFAQATPGVSDPHGGKVPGPAADTTPSDGAAGSAAGGKNTSSDATSGSTTGQTAVPNDTAGQARNPAEAEKMKEEKSH